MAGLQARPIHTLRMSEGEQRQQHEKEMMYSEVDLDLAGKKTPHNDKNQPLKVVFVRHGESTWNKSGKFSGWTDIPLNEKGENQAREAGKLLKELGYDFDVAYTSKLDRAIRTCEIILEEMDLSEETFVKQSWRINERHYGNLQGKCKKQAAETFGADQVKLWR